MGSNNLPTNIYEDLSIHVPSQQIVADGSMINSNLGIGDSQAIRVFDIPSTELAQFSADVLGYSRSLGPGEGLHRQLPSQHPELPWMYATKITSVQGLGPIGQYDAPGGVSALWKAYRVTVQYETPPYNVFSDDQVSEENNRFTSFDGNPASQFIQRQAGSFYFPAGAGGEATAKPISAAASLTVSQLVSKTKYTITWYNVPDFGLWKNGFMNGSSPNIEKGIGCVNSSTWPTSAWPAQTLLLTGWEAHWRIMPIAPSLLRVNSGGFTFPPIGTPPRAWDVVLHMLYFNPTNVGVGGPTPITGHNCAPNPVDNKWWRVYTAAGDNTNGWRYPAYEFTNLFLMNS